MRLTIIIPITIYLSLFGAILIAQDNNPFMQMAGKKYSDYSEALFVEYSQFLKLDTVEIRKVIRQIEEVAEKTGSMEWKLLSSYFEAESFHRKRELYGEQLYPKEESLKKALKLLNEAEKAKIMYLGLIIRQKIIDYYWIYFNDYESAFEQYGIMENRLKKVLSGDIPEKVDYYRKIADAYYFFKDYPKAISYFNKVLEEKDYIRNLHSKQHARNGMGLSYQEGFNDLDRSDSCFYSIMQAGYLNSDFEFFREAWNGIAEGNIGYNMLLRGKYDQAIPLLKSSIEKMLKYDDYGFASGPAINLADIYLRKGNISEAKRYIDLAREYYDTTPRDGRLPRIYEMLNKYYSAIGNPKLSMVYMDSTLQANKQYEEQFNILLLLRMEQKELAKRQQELAQEKEIRQHTQVRLLILSAGFIVISVLLVSLFISYNRKRAACRELVRKSQQWAQIQSDIINVQPNGQNNLKDLIEQEYEAQNTLPDKIDFSIMKEIKQLMLEGKIYQDNNLSVDSLANKLGAKRHYISRAINRCTNNNFNTFVNEYRIKEAIRIMSEKNFQIYSVEGIAFDLGFNDRKNFYRVFKKMTGLSPTEFRKNITV